MESMTPIVFFLLFCTRGTRVILALEQSFSEQPQDVTVHAGDKLVLPCKVKDKIGDCQWTKDGFGLGVKTWLPGFPRYSMSEQGGGSCDLIIEPVLPADEASYTCQVGVGKAYNQKPIVSRAAKVRVTSEPGKPYIKQATDYDVKEILEGSHVVLDCVTQGARPAAEIKWYRNGLLIESAKMQEMVTLESGGRTFRTHSSITLKPTSKSTMIKCSSNSEEFSEPKFSQELEIRLRYAPKVNLEINKEKIKEGDKFSVTCNSKAYPENVAYKWYFNDQELTSENKNILDVEEISRKHHESSIKCSVRNEIGTTEVATKLDVQFPPKILKHPTSKIAKRGENVTFSCVAESNPGPNYIWTRHEDDKLEAVTQNITVEASEKTEKTYVCKVFSGDHEVISSLPAKLILLRRPVIYLEMFKEAVEGGDLALTCLVDSLSNHTKIVWTKEDELLDTKRERVRVNEDHKGREFTSDLIITDVDSSDFGHYGCFAVNEVGKDYSKVIVRTKVKSSLSTGLGIGISVGFVALFVLLILFKVRRTCSENTLVGNSQEMKPMKGF